MAEFIIMVWACVLTIPFTLAMQALSYLAAQQTLLSLYSEAPILPCETQLLALGIFILVYLVVVLLFFRSRADETAEFRAVAWFSWMVLGIAQTSYWHRLTYGYVPLAYENPWFMVVSSGVWALSCFVSAAILVSAVTRALI